MQKKTLKTKVTSFYHVNFTRKALPPKNVFRVLINAVLWDRIKVLRRIQQRDLLKTAITY